MLKVYRLDDVLLKYIFNYFVPLQRVRFPEGPHRVFKTLKYSNYRFLKVKFSFYSISVWIFRELFHMRTHIIHYCLSIYVILTCTDSEFIVFLIYTYIYLFCLLTHIQSDVKSVLIIFFKLRIYKFEIFYVQFKSLGLKIHVYEKKN